MELVFIAIIVIIFNYVVYRLLGKELQLNPYAWAAGTVIGILLTIALTTYMVQ